MKKSKLSVIFLLMVIVFVSAVANVNSQTPPTFSSGFESLITQEWSGTYVKSGTISLVQSAFHHGTSSLQSKVTASNGYAFVYKLIPAQYPVFARAYFTLSRLPSEGKKYSLIGFEKTGWGTVGAISLMNDAGTLKWSMRYYTGSQALTYSMSSIPTENTWFSLELKYSSGSGGAEFYVNGTKLVSVSSMGQVIDRVGFGLHHAATANYDTDTTLYTDCAVIGTAYIGPEDLPPPPPPTPATLTVDTTPVQGEVYVNDVSWGSAPQTRDIDPGTYQVSFGDVDGYFAPEPQTITLAENETRTVTGTYQEILPGTPLFSSGFENDFFASGEWDGWWPQYPLGELSRGTVTDGYPVFNGSYSARTAGMGWGKQKMLYKNLGVQLNEIYVRTYVYFPSLYTYPHQDTGEDCYWTYFLTIAPDYPVPTSSVSGRKAYVSGFLKISYGRQLERYVLSGSYWNGEVGNREYISAGANLGEIEAGRWYYVEWYHKMASDYGVRDGIWRLYVDDLVPGEPHVYYEDTEVPNYEPNGPYFGAVFLGNFETPGSQNPDTPAPTMYFDSVVVSDQYIGPESGLPPAPPPPPPTPATLTVDTTPVQGEVYVNDVSWGSAPQTRDIDPGTYQVSFGDVDGYFAPEPQTITLAENETRTVTGTYQEILPGTPLFSSGFELPINQEWTGEQNWGGAPSVLQRVNDPYEGQWSLEASASCEFSRRVVYKTVAPQQTFYARYYVRFDTEIPLNQWVIPCFITTGPDSFKLWCCVRVYHMKQWGSRPEGYYWLWEYYDGGSGMHCIEPSTILTPVIGQWYCIELMVQRASALGVADGKFALWIDGDLIYRADNINNFERGNGIDTIMIGVCETHLAGTQHVTIDNVAVNNQRIGP